MHIAESALMPLEGIHLRQHDGNLSIGAFDFTNPGGSPDHLHQLIAEYSRKILTYERDTLNAMNGIVTHFGKLQPPVDNLMGIPMVYLYVRSYRPLNCFLAGLSWRLRKAGTRKLDFPSWTWAGWDGMLDYPWLLITHDWG